MKGILFPGESKINLTTFIDPTPEPDEVIIKMEVSGICGTDVRYWQMPDRGPAAKIIPGHEVSGTVVEVGRFVKNFSVGDRVIANSHIGCGHCTYCLRSEFVFCKEKQVLGRLRNGSDAEYISVPERGVLPLPERFSFADGAVIACSMTTAYSGLRKLDDVSGCAYVMISGCGPVGLSAALMAVAMGAHVMAVDLSDPRLELAKEFGVERVHNPKKGDLQAAVQDWTKGHGIDGVVECSGASAAYTAAFANLAPHGTLVMVGVTDHFVLDPDYAILGELRVRGSAVYKQWEYEPLISFLTDHALSLEKLRHAEFPIEKAEEALQTAASTNFAKILFRW